MLLTAAYGLLAPWVFVLAPLVTLLVVFRPSSRREWIALAVAVPLLVLSLASVGGLFQQFVRASGVMLSGAFVALMLSRPGPVFSRALAATGIAGAATLLVGRYLGFGWPAVQAAAARETATFFSAQATAAAAQGAAGDAAKQVFTELAQRSESVAALFPAILVLAALAGLALAWRLFQQLASRPVPWIAGSFGSFRFGDQVVWVPVLALALLVFPVSGAANGISLTVAAQNVLLVSVALYAMRGLAVFWTVARAAPRAIVLALTLVAVFLSPFAVSGLALLGLADSWVDFRRRVAPPTTGGFNP